MAAGLPQGPANGERGMASPFMPGTGAIGFDCGGNWAGGKELHMTNITLRGTMILAVATGALALGGCATTGSVKRAQARADAAYSYADTANGAAQHAQGSADGAMTAAQRAQMSADGAMTAAQRAQMSADGAGASAQGAAGQIARLNARVRHLEVEEARHRAHERRHHRRHRVTSPKVQAQSDAHFHGS